jgi:hypothetical protein
MLLRKENLRFSNTVALYTRVAAFCPLKPFLPRATVRLLRDPTVVGDNGLPGQRAEAKPRKQTRELCHIIHGRPVAIDRAWILMPSKIRALVQEFGAGNQMLYRMAVSRQRLLHSCSSQVLHKIFKSSRHSRAREHICFRFALVSPEGGRYADMRTYIVANQLSTSKMHRRNGPPSSVIVS